MPNETINPNGSLLSRGMRDAQNPDIEVAQSLLAYNGFDTDGEEGFGPRTEAAVRAFQEAEGLKVNGVVGLHTWKALRAGQPAATRVTTNEVVFIADLDGLDVDFTDSIFGEE